MSGITNTLYVDEHYKVVREDGYGRKGEDLALLEEYILVVLAKDVVFKVANNIKVHLPISKDEGIYFVIVDIKTGPLSGKEVQLPQKAFFDQKQINFERI